MKLSPVLLAVLFLPLLVHPCRAEDPPVFSSAFGSLGSGDGQFIDPHGVGIDVAGYIYVADTGNGRIQKFSPTGVYLAQWNGSATPRGPFNPIDVAVSSGGTFYVSSFSRVDVFGSDLSFQREWIGPTGSLALDPTEQYLYTTNGFLMYKYRVSDGALVGSWQYAGSSPGLPIGLGVGPSGIIYAPSDGYVQKFAPDGTFLGHWPSATFLLAGPLTVDSSENLFVIAGSSELQKYTSDGGLLSQVVAPGSGMYDIAMDSALNIYVLSQDSNQILKFVYPAVPVVKQSWSRLKLLYR